MYTGPKGVKRGLRKNALDHSPNKDKFQEPNWDSVHGAPAGRVSGSYQDPVGASEFAGKTTDPSAPFKVGK